MLHFWVKLCNYLWILAMKIHNNSKDLPVIDWELGKKLAGNDMMLAEEMLFLFAKSLPQELESIKIAKDCENPKELLSLLHRLRGAVSYCGLPRLKAAIIDYENQIKLNPIGNNEEAYQDFESEVVEVVRSATRNVNH